MKPVFEYYYTWLRYLMIPIALGLSGKALVMAQPYPVTVIVQVAQFSPLPEVYDDPGRVVITLISTDTRPEYPATFAPEIVGPGI